MGKSPKTFSGTAAANAGGPASKQRMTSENGGEGSSFEAELQQAMVAFRKGDLSVRLPTGWDGVQGRIADLFNEVVEMSERRAQQAADRCC